MTEPENLNGMIAGDDGSSDNILDLLNYDCLVHVFEYLQLRDLCNVAESCCAFKSATLSIFKRRYSVLDTDQLLVESDTDDGSDNDGSDNDGSDNDGSDNDGSDNDGSDNDGNVDDSNSDDEYYGSDSDDESQLSSMDVAWNIKHQRYNPVRPRRPPRRFDVKTAERFFRHSGAYIKSITFTERYYNQMNYILYLMATHCSGQDAVLTTLKMIDVEIVSKSLRMQLQPLFDRLTFLDIVGGSISSLCIGVELTELTLEYAYLSDYFTKELKKLHTLSLTDVEAGPGPVGIFESFFQMATRLRRLSIMGKLREGKWSLANLPAELEELEIDVVGEHRNIIEEFMTIGQLRMLKVLKLNCMYRPMWMIFNSLVEQNVPIEELGLKCFALTTNNAIGLARLSKIKKLSFIDGEWTHYVPLSDVIEAMPDLEQLSLIEFRSVTIDNIKSTIEKAPKLKIFLVNVRQDNVIEIGIRSYNEICEVIRNRSDALKLSLELTGANIQMNVPKCVMEMNRLWLQVTINTFVDVQPVNIFELYGFSEDSDSEAGSVSKSP